MGMIINVTWMPGIEYGGTIPGRLALQKAINEANAGAGETDGNNKSERIFEYWGDLVHTFYGSSWCAAFTSWAFLEADGFRAFPQFPMALNIRNYFRNMKWLYFDSKQGSSQYTGAVKPEPGDVVIFDRGEINDALAHVGIVHHAHNGSLITIEGNHHRSGETLAKVQGFEYDLDAMPRLLAFGRVPDDYKSQINKVA